MQEQASAPVIGRLVSLELHCLLRRRIRAGDFGADYAALAYDAFLGHMADGIIELVAMTDRMFERAGTLIEELDDVPLRTLDALHLAAARDLAVDEIATADRVMAQAARRLGFRAVLFLDP